MEQMRMAVREFERAGRRYRWSEGALHPAAARFRGRRGELATALGRTLVPALARRGAVRTVVAVPGATRAWWVTWGVAGEAPVWALYVSTRSLGVCDNDGALLAGWGDGPVLAWASQSPPLREALRHALATVPGFLAEGVCSADETFAVRLTAA